LVIRPRSNPCPADPPRGPSPRHRRDFRPSYGRVLHYRRAFQAGRGGDGCLRRRRSSRWRSVAWRGRPHAPGESRRSLRPARQLPQLLRHCHRGPPPMPASISSKTNVSSPPAPASAHFSASRTRESSPPDAVRARLRAGWPAFAASSSSAASAPVSRRPSQPSRVSRATVMVAEVMPSPAS